MRGNNKVRMAVTRWLAAATMTALFFGVFFVYYIIRGPIALKAPLTKYNSTMHGSLPIVRCTSPPSSSDELRMPLPSSKEIVMSPASSDELHSAILHYATSPVVPQQTQTEIRISFDVLRNRAPCNFLVFGLGHDSPMWSAFNAGGTTFFLEEDPQWFQSVLRQSPSLHAHHVKYPTKLSEANELIKSYRDEPECLPPQAHIRGNQRCRLALANLPVDVYEREWDLIMIDAPKGYFAEAPGRMGAIYSAAVMARGRKGKGFTDVFLHDVDRRVERMFAMEFLCKKNLVEEKGRLWHFRIPPATVNETAGIFC